MVLTVGRNRALVDIVRVLKAWDCGACHTSTKALKFRIQNISTAFHSRVSHVIVCYKVGWKTGAKKRNNGSGHVT